jgi:hypothetical protein
VVNARNCEAFLLSGTFDHAAGRAKGCRESEASDDNPALMGRVLRLTHDGAWTWFNDPRAIVFGDQLFTGWITRAGDVQLSRIDLSTRSQRTLTLEGSFEPDDHDNPALIANPDGTIGIYYARHNGSAIRTATASSATNGSLQASEPQDVPVSADDVIGPHGWTYANPFRLHAEDNRLYLFSRGRNFNPVVREFDGVRWSAARNLVLNPGERPYVKYASNHTDTIGFAYTDAHPNREPGNNIYYAELRDGAAWRADGTKIKDLAAGPLSIAESPKVFDRTADPIATGGNAWIWDVALDGRTGHPSFVFSTFPRLATHQYHYARWTGAAWADRILLEDAGGAVTGSTSVEPHYSGGIALDRSDPNTLYLSRCEGGEDGAWRIEQWKTDDLGTSWSRRTIANGAGPDEKLFRPVVPLNRPQHTQMVLWLAGRYDYWNFSRGIGYHTGVHLWTDEG